MNWRSKLSKVALAAPLCVAACGGFVYYGEYRLEVDSSPRLCISFGSPNLCLWTRPDDEHHFRHWDRPINGFDPVWGTRFELAVTDSPVPNPAAQGSGIATSLNQVLAATEDPIGSTYRYEQVDMNDRPIVFDGLAFSFLGRPFSCAPGADCTRLLDLSGSGSMVTIEFRYVGNGAVELDRWWLE